MKTTPPNPTLETNADSASLRRHRSALRWAQMRTLSCILSALTFLTLVEHAFGLSGFVRLTGTNIHSAYSFIAIKADTAEGGLRRFRVIVLPREGVNPAHFTGSLSVYDSTSNLVASCTVSTTKLPAKSRDVAEAFREKAVVFEFMASLQFLENSKFFVTEQPPDIPSFTSYWFYLKDFVDAQ